MKFTRGKDIKETLRVGIPHIDAVNIIKTTYADLPIHYEPNPNFYDDFKKNVEYEEISGYGEWTTVGTFSVENPPYPSTVRLQVGVDSVSYTVLCKKPTTVNIRHFIKDWQKYGYNQFYDILMDR